MQVSADRIPKPAAVLALLTLALGLLVNLPARAVAATALTQRWTQSLGSAPDQWSSPVIANLTGGGNAVVVGSENGNVYAFDASGNALPGWPVHAANAVDSSPAVGDLDGNGQQEVAVGLGSLSVAGQGGLAIINANGQVRCTYQTQTVAGTSAVFNAPAIGDVLGNGRNQIVFGAFDHYIYVLDNNCHVLASYNNADTVWSAPALYDAQHTGQDEIFIGNDSSAGGGGTYHNGGIYRALAYRGGTLVELWERSSNEDFQGGSSIGDIDGSGRMAVVTGSGAYWCRHFNQCSDSSKVWAFYLDNGADVPGWPKASTYNTFLSAPSLADLDGDGRADVVIGSVNYVNDNPTAGAVDAYLSSTGFARKTWISPVEVEASPVVGNFTGAGTQVAVDGEILDKNLNPVATFNGANKTAVAVGQLGSGPVLVTAKPGSLIAYNLPSLSGATWPMFQQNPQRTGTSQSGVFTISCNAGYWLGAADGGIFNYGDATFHGSAGGIHLNSPVVGLAGAPAAIGRTGYWMVARDGGIFNYGTPFFGSAGGIHLNQPVVGMASTVSGNGYWLAASDGGIFNYGAPFFGSAGGIHLNSPVVGIAAAPGGNGYWMVAKDGGIFNYGSAGFHGSAGGIHLNKPIVGMAATPDGGGYWLVASDGGIFNYGDAPFFGSAGGIHLNSPIVGMAATSDGAGYWLVAADGGIFSYGDAQFCGSAGSIRLNSPIVGMAAS